MLEMYLSPFRSIVENLHWKLAFAVVVTPFANLLPESAGDLLNLPPSLLVIVLGLWLLDFLSGVTKAIREGGVGSISSRGFRQTIIKLIEYAIFLLACDLFASTSQWAGVIGVALERVDTVGGIILAATEFRSIDENLQWNMLERMAGILNFKGLFKKQGQS